MTTNQERPAPDESKNLLVAKQAPASGASRAEVLARCRARGIKDLPPAADVLADQRPNH